MSKLVPSRITDAFERIEEAAYRIISKGTVPVGFGGDGSVSLPLLRAASRIHPNLAVLHIDSHTDAYEPDPEHPSTRQTSSPTPPANNASASAPRSISACAAQPLVPASTRRAAKSVTTSSPMLRVLEARVWTRSSPPSRKKSAIGRFICRGIWMYSIVVRAGRLHAHLGRLLAIRN